MPLHVIFKDGLNLKNNTLYSHQGLGKLAVVQSNKMII